MLKPREMADWSDESASMCECFYFQPGNIPSVMKANSPSSKFFSSVLATDHFKLHYITSKYQQAKLIIN